MSALRHYPYFWTTAIGALAVAIMIAASRRHRKAILLSALAGLPPAMFSPAFEGCYWKPRRLLGGGLGIEDFLCGFMVAGMLWWAVCLIPQFHRLETDFSRFWSRYWLVAIPAIVASYGAYFAGMDGLTLALIGPAVAAVILAFLDPSLWRFSAAGLAAFLVLWWGNLKLYFLVWPHFPVDWNQTAWFGRSFAGVPAAELLWAAAFGVCWPAFMAWCMDAKPLKFTNAGRQ